MLDFDLEQEFERIRLKHGGGVFASANVRYGEAIFGRDSLEVAEDILDFKPKVVEEILVTLAHLQGTVYKVLNEEEPGKIHHEYRAMVMDGRPISPHGQKILKHLVGKWGGENERLVYYGSVDATPLFVRLVGRYCQQYGADLLERSIERLDGTHVTLRQSVMGAIGWIESTLQSSPWGLVTFCRTNPIGHKYQAWKDSNSSYLHLNGLAANYQRPIASLEVQGYAYDALLGASELGLSLTQDELVIRRWAMLAKQLQSRVVELFWMHDQHFWAQAIDEDVFGQPRQVATLTSNAGLLLESRLLDTLPLEAQREYVIGTVTMLCSDDFVTEVGVRCRAWQHHGLINFADYHGSLTVWPKETYDIAKGLRRQGLEHLAEQLERRILNGIGLSGSCYELWYVDGKGRVVYDPTNQEPKNAEVILGTNLPESMQSWTISAALAITRQSYMEAAEPSWRTDFERRVIATMPHVSLLKSAEQAKQVYPKHTFYVDLKNAEERQDIFITKPLA
jgi:glycogen debranching enzyme